MKPYGCECKRDYAFKIHEGQSRTVGTEGIFTHSNFKAMVTETQLVFYMLYKMYPYTHKPDYKYRR